MAMDLSSVKASRTTAKRAVTNAAKRLEQAIGLQLSSTPQLANNLEKRFVEFNEFCDSFNSIAIDQAVPVENTLVNGLTPEQYEDETLQTFKAAMQSYRDSISTCVPVSSPSPSTSVHLKRREIPTFSGERRDWPEFKRMWQELVVPAVGNKVALASDLKKACKAGKAFEEIENISAGAIDGYDLMWAALCQHYDNVVLAVSSAMSELKEMKTVDDNDY